MMMPRPLSSRPRWALVSPAHSPERRAILAWTLAAFAVALSGIACTHSSSPPPPSGADGGSPADRHDAAGDSPDIICPPTAIPGMTLKSLPCVCDSECASGHCADGVCCDTACTENCKSCALPSSRGLCSLIPAGLPPTRKSQCVATDASTCGLDGTCDGNGGCARYVANTPCKTGVCAGSGVSGQFVCDGQGTCGLGPGKSCFPFSCDPATNDCASTCATSGQCAENQTCIANSCGKSMNGAVCKADTDCSSGHCTDGVCCVSACAGPCQACNLDGSKGSCALISAGKMDPTFCMVMSYTTCGTTGACDGRGACSVFPANTLCGPPVCAGDTAQNLPPTCDGQGTCQDPALHDCGAYRCGPTGACNDVCTTDGDCAPTRPCIMGKCSGDKLAIGQKCTQDSQCGPGTDANAHCVDGVCCESTCAGACRSCALPGSLGMCVNAAAGAADPRLTCQNTGKASCGTDGLCDGTGACEKFAVDTECAGETCAGGAYTPASKCNASGQCVTPTSRSCNPYQCSGSKCASTCTPTNMATQCLPPNSCVGGSCGPKPGGADCGAGTECVSGLCAQGVCCNTACQGACMACNLTGSPGICTAVPDGRPDPQNICPFTASTTCGTTGMCKGGACAFWASGQNCKAAKCVTPALSSVTPVSTCDGKGTCVTPANQSCGTFTCDNTKSACRSSCTVATQTTDCLGSNTCGSGNSCGLKPPGATCTSGAQCASNFCTEGVCCNSACSDATTGTAGLCLSCKVAGKVGTCSPVVAGGADPKARCVATNPSPATGAGNCANDGTCNGAGACRPWSTATGCRQASCTGSTFTPAANCDGKGVCATAAPSMCNPFVCSTTSPSCLTTCTKDADCTGGQTCLKTTNRCGTTLPQGSSCVANTDCTTGICNSEKVCCNAACAGACQSCTLTGKVGTCSAIGAGGTPRDLTTCAAMPGNVCGNTTRCDGSGGCQLAAAGLTCGPATCAPAVSGTVGGMSASESLAVIPTRTCNGAGICTTPAAVDCGAYQCNGGVSPAVCKTTCTATATDCDALVPPAGGGNSCVGAICQKKGNGLTCTAGSECVSGACVDNGTGSTICCASACTAQADVCGTSGFCSADGLTCPKKQAAGSQCLPGTCAPGTTGVAPRTCSAAGTCTAGGGALCTSGQMCSSASVCATPLANGAACVADVDCASSHCVSTSPSAKVCSAVVCTNTASPCGNTGFVNAGGTACLNTDGVACGPAATCPAGTPGADVRLCAGTTCPPAAPICTGGLVCTGSGLACAKSNGTSCSMDGDCASGHCDNAVGGGKVCAAIACPSGNASNPCGAPGLVRPDGTCVPNNNGVPCGTATCPMGTAGTNVGVCVGATCAPGPAICTSPAVCTGVGLGCMLRGNGASCTDPGQCTSGACVDTGAGSVCCVTACPADTSSSTCGNTGLCASNGSACVSKPTSFVCSPPNCSDAGKTCDGNGSCSGPGPGVITCAMGTMCDSSGACI